MGRAHKPSDMSGEAESLRKAIAQKLERIGEPSLRKVLSFVEYLDRNGKTPNGDDPFFAVIGTLSGEPISSEEIDEELYGPVATREG